MGDIDSKLSKLLWKYGSNTVIRCDFVNISSLPPLSQMDKEELSRPSHPHQTPGLSLKSDVDVDVDEEDDAEAAEQAAKPDNEVDIDGDNGDAEEEQKEPQQLQVAQQKVAAAPVTEASFVLGINEFYYLFLFLEDKLPELASWLMQQSELNQSHVMLRALSAKLIGADAAE